MQKVVELLERHVQWLALGLGVVWLLYMTYSYVLIPPAEVEIGGTTLRAADVDEYAVDNAAKQLEQAMTTPPELPEMKPQEFAQAWQAKMNWADAAPVATPTLVFSPPPFSEAWFPNIQLPVPGVPLPGAQQGVAAGGPQQPKGNIPILASAKPTPSDYRFGRSTAIQPPPLPAPLAPGQLPPPPAPAALPQEVDKDWVTQSFKVSIPAISDAFKAAQVPTPIFKTVFLKLEVDREELMANGKWGNKVTLTPLNTGVLRQPFPAPKAGRGAETAYYNWAVANQGDILQPAFYQTVQGKGDHPWRRPGAKGEPQLPQQAFNPATWVGGKEGLTDEQWKEVLKFRAERAKQNRMQRKAAPRRPRGAPDEGMMEDPGLNAPRDAGRPQFYQVQPRRGYPPPGYDPAMMDPSMDPSMMDPSMMEGEMGGVPQPIAPTAGIPGIDYPNGEFDPSTWAVPVPGAPVPPPGAPQQTPEIDVWAHDETVQPGKTYRYKLRYFIKNPLWQAAPALLKNKKDADQFLIVSPDSDWSSNVEVPPLTNFFIASGNAGQLPKKVKFEVYRWKGGVQHLMTQEAGPGDVLGKAQEAADFTTGHMVVDIRLDAKSREPVVILANERGDTIVRSSKVDFHSTLRKKLSEEVKAAQAPVAAAGR